MGVRSSTATVDISRRITRALRLGLTLRDPDVLTKLAAHGVTDIIVDREPDPGGRWDKYRVIESQRTLVCTEGKQSCIA